MTHGATETPLAAYHSSRWFSGRYLYGFCVMVVNVQERDKLTVAAEGATRLRIKNQEILAKEEQVRALLASNRTKLDNLLGTRGKGIHLEPLRHMFLLWSGNIFLL